MLSTLNFDPPFTRSRVKNIRKYMYIPEDKYIKIATAFSGIN